MAVCAHWPSTGVSHSQSVTLGLSAMYLQFIIKHTEGFAPVLRFDGFHPYDLSMWMSPVQSPVCSLNVRPVPPLNRLHSLYVGRPRRVTPPVPSYPWENILLILRKERRFYLAETLFYTQYPVKERTLTQDCSTYIENCKSPRSDLPRQSPVRHHYLYLYFINIEKSTGATFSILPWHIYVSIEIKVLWKYKKAQIEIQFVFYNYGQRVGQFFKIVSIPCQFFTLLLSLNTRIYNLRILQMACELICCHLPSHFSLVSL